MNMQKKQYTVQFFSHSPMTNCVASPRAATVEHRTHGFNEFWGTPEKKTKLTEKLELPEKKKGITVKRRFLPLSQPLAINGAWCLWYGIFPLASLGWLPGCGPSQLLHICLLAKHGKLKKVLDFLATTKTISVINIILILNPKLSSYWEEN